MDEDAIRWIEEQNPDIQFDWQKILEAQPPAGQAPDEAKPRRLRRDSPERGKAASRPSEEPGETPGGVEAAENAESGFVDAVDDFAPPGNDEEETDDAAIEIAVDTVEMEDAAEALEQLTHPDIEGTVEPPQLPVTQALDTEQLTRLRARYVEIQRRITERGGERVEELRLQAESLNPDAWVTEGEIRKGLEEFESRIRDIRGALGLRRRRRSRRGGRRARPDQPAEGQ